MGRRRGFPASQAPTGVGCVALEAGPECPPAVRSWEASHPLTGAPTRPDTGTILERAWSPPLASQLLRDKLPPASSLTCWRPATPPAAAPVGLRLGTCLISTVFRFIPGKKANPFFQTPVSRIPQSASQGVAAIHGMAPGARERKYYGSWFGFRAP